MPKIRTNTGNDAQKPAEPDRLRSGSRLMDKPEIETFPDKGSLDEPVEVDLATEEDYQAEAERRREERKARKTEDEGVLGSQAREAREADEARQRVEAESRRQQQEAYQAYQHSQAELANERRAREQADYDSVVAHISSAQSEYETAQRDYVAARQGNDFAAEADAQGRMARSQARLVQLEQGKETLEARAKDPVQAQPGYQPPAPQRSATQIINSMQALVPEEREWLMRHQELVTDPKKVQELQGTYYAAERAGLARGTPEYFDFFEERLGLSNDGNQPARQKAPARRLDRQAPPSRAGVDLTSGRQREDTGSKITLTAQQRQAAQWSGVSEHEYALGLKRLQDYKRQGYYSDNQ